jgi:serine/threonine protein kinase
MNVSGISNSVRIQSDVAVCPRCGSTSRVGRGLCLNCLLQAGLGTETGNNETLESVLAEIDIPDADWRLGNYQILEEIGRGGMGVIYRARQRHSRRIVALKRVLSYHADSRETLARFRREAEAAASLDHPNILPIYEVSEGEDGLPFFSMKFAAGGSLLDAGPALRDEPRRSVALIAKVARAVQYAHGQGILHRDLKPGNVLLDGCGEPLVSDFGLAKWLDTTSDVTRTLTIFGTPGYIAPEQARGPAAKLTAAADVYSLGAILFDLLTGRPPFLGEHALAVIQQASERPAPKLRVLAPKLDRDLETICAKCLEREPDARYRSAWDLAEDLERWLEGRPIKTRRVLPPTRAWRWSRRNPVLVGTAAVCLFLGAASIWLLRQPNVARQISAATKALMSPREAAEQSKLRQALVSYPELRTELEQSHVSQGRASIEERLYAELATSIGFNSKLLRDKLPKFADVVKRDPDRISYERASAAYVSEDYTEAERLSLQAADDVQKGSPSRTTDVIRALELAAFSACKSDEFTRAREHLGEAQKSIDPQRNPREWANVNEAIANVLLAENEHFGEAEKIIRSVIEVRTQVYGPEHRETLRARGRLALAFFREAKYAEAETEYRELIRVDEKILGPEHPETLFTAWDLATVMGRGNNVAAALNEHRRVLQLREKVLGPEHPDTLASRNGVAVTLSYLSEFTEAIAQWRQLLKVQEKVLGQDDNQTLNTMMNIGYILAEAGEYQQGEAMLRRAYNGRERTLGPTKHDTLYCRASLAMTLAVQDQNLKAEAEAREIVKLSDKSVGAERSGWTRDVLAAVLDMQGKHSEAEAQIRQAVRLNEKALGRDDDDTRNSRGHLAKNLWYQGKNTEAENLLRELITLNEKIMGAHVYLLENNVSSRLFEELTPFLTRTLLANTLRDQEKYAEAEADYKQVIHLEEKVLGPDQRDTLNACYNYSYHLAQQGKRNEAKGLAERAAQGATKVLGPNDPNTREYVKFLEILENGQPITVPYMKFHETFLSGNRVIEQGPR